MNLFSFREAIDPESKTLQPLKKKAVRLDGDKDGLKSQLYCGSMKSCDYLDLKDGGRIVKFIEISDLTFQVKNLITKGMDQKEVDSLIRKELIDKFVGTLAIYLILERELSKKKKRSFEFIVAVVTANSSDIVAFQKIKEDITSYIKEKICAVKMVPFGELEGVI